MFNKKKYTYLMNKYIFKRMYDEHFSRKLQCKVCTIKLYRSIVKFLSVGWSEKLQF